MKVLLTGGFGTVGLSILDLLIAKGPVQEGKRMPERSTMTRERMPQANSPGAMTSRIAPSPTLLGVSLERN